MNLNLKTFIYKKTPNFIKLLIPKFIIRKLKKNFYPFYYLMTDLKNLPHLNYTNNNNYETQEELISKFKINQKQNSWMSCPYLHELLLMKYKAHESFSFLDIGGEYIDFFLQLKKNFKNINYYFFNLEKINNNFEMIKKKYSYDNLYIIKDLSFIYKNKYDFVNLGSSIQYFDNFETILKNVTNISNNIFFSGTILFESNKESYKKFVVVEQIHLYPEKNYCYFFNKKYFYNFFYNKEFYLLFSKKNLAASINFINFQNIFEKIEYKDFFFTKNPQKFLSEGSNFV